QKGIFRAGSGVIRAGGLSFSRRPATEVATPRLSVISAGRFGRVVWYWAAHRGSINEDKPVICHLHRIKQQAFITRLLAVFDQDSGGSVEPPHHESGAEQTAVRVKLVQTVHGMKTTEVDLVYSIMTSVCAV